jgi:hypothetical protein
MAVDWITAVQFLVGILETFLFTCNFRIAIGGAYGPLSCGLKITRTCRRPYTSV